MISFLIIAAKAFLILVAFLFLVVIVFMLSRVVFFAYFKSREAHIEDVNELMKKLEHKNEMDKLINHK